MHISEFKKFSMYISVYMIMQQHHIMSHSIISSHSLRKINIDKYTYLSCWDEIEVNIEAENLRRQSQELTSVRLRKHLYLRRTFNNSCTYYSLNCLWQMIQKQLHFSNTLLKSVLSLWSLFFLHQNEHLILISLIFSFKVMTSISTLQS